MYFLTVAHVDDNDADYFSFSNLDRAMKYIIEENLSEWELSDLSSSGMPEQDYTYIES